MKYLIVEHSERPSIKLIQQLFDRCNLIAEKCMSFYNSGSFRIAIQFYCNKSSKVHVFWEGHKILQNLHRRFDRDYINVAFFQKERFIFQISKIKIFQKTILSLKFEFPANYSILLLAWNLNFKFRIVFWNSFFWDLRNELYFLKKSHL